MAPHPYHTDSSSTEFSSDAQLLAALRRGDAVASEQFVRQFGGRMLAVARRFVQNEADAQDCVQEAFLQAFRHLHQFEGRSSLMSWLHRIVVNVALKKLRAQPHQTAESLDALMPQFDTYGCRTEPLSEDFLPVETLVAKQETRVQVQRAIETLPETYQWVLVLRDIEGFTTEETAEALGLTITNVKSRLHRARAALKRQLESVLREGES